MTDDEVRQGVLQPCPSDKIPDGTKKVLTDREEQALLEYLKTQGMPPGHFTGENAKDFTPFLSNPALHQLALHQFYSNNDVLNKVERLHRKGRLIGLNIPGYNGPTRRTSNPPTRRKSKGGRRRNTI